jgi:hypothetical protein
VAAKSRNEATWSRPLGAKGESLGVLEAWRVRASYVGFVGLATKPAYDGFLVCALKSNPDTFQEASKQGRHGMSASLASKGSRVAVDTCPPDEEIYDLPQIPFHGLVSYFKF